MSHPVVPWYCIRTLRPSRRDRKPQSASSSSLEDRVTETQNDTPEKWLFIFMMMASPDYSYSWWWLTWLFIFMMMTAPDYSVFIFMKELNTTLELSTSIHIYDFFYSNTRMWRQLERTLPCATRHGLWRAFWHSSSPKHVISQLHRKYLSLW